MSEAEYAEKRQKAINDHNESLEKESTSKTIQVPYAPQTTPISVTQSADGRSFIGPLPAHVEPAGTVITEHIDTTDVKADEITEESLFGPSTAKEAENQ